MESNAPDPVTSRRDNAIVDRILDANLNRATEAMRTVEEVARFGLNDAFLASSFKNVRHELSTLIHRLMDWPARMSSRDSRGDVGANLSTWDEYQRGSIRDVAARNLQRAQQAVRALEEFAKLRDASVASDIERIRFRLYTLDNSVIRVDTARHRLAQCQLCVLVHGDPDMARFRTLINELCGSGVDMIQLRDKSLPDRKLGAYAEVLVELTRSAEVVSIINDRVDIAAAVQADGVHLGQEDLEVCMARRLLADDGLVGVSTHSMVQVQQAIVAGADYLGVGPVFPSKTKEFEKLPGVSLVRDVACNVGTPWFAIGGISEVTLPEVLQAGASRVAMGNAIISSSTPGDAVTAVTGHFKTSHTGAP